MRKSLQDFEPYQWEMSTKEIASSVGLDPQRIVRMDTNTSPFLPEVSLNSLAKQIRRFRVNEYPDTSYIELRKSLSSYCGKDVDRFVVTNGADEALDIVSKVFLDPKDETIIPYPTYSMYRIVTEIMGARPIFVKRKKDLALDEEEIKRSISSKTKLIFLCNPNNPTGDSISVKQARTILDSTDAIVVADEAYYEFSGKTLAPLTDKYDNLIVIRTFSKAFSMAGVRVGYTIASKKTTDKLNLVRPPNSLGVISLKLAQNALKDRKSMEANVRKIIEERKRCSMIMQEMGGVVTFLGEGNFILFRVKNGSSRELHSRLMKKGFVLRDFSDTPAIEGCLRVTMNTRKNNDAFLDSLRKLAG